MTSCWPGYGPMRKCNRLPSPLRLPLASRLCDLLGVVTGFLGECFADRVDLFDDGVYRWHACCSMASSMSAQIRGRRSRRGGLQTDTVSGFCRDLIRESCQHRPPQPSVQPIEVGTEQDLLSLRRTYRDSSLLQNREDGAGNPLHPALHPALRLALDATL